MRVQIYQEELGEGVEIISQTSRNGEVFVGLRIWLKTCQSLLDHSTPEDDDRSAITFWMNNSMGGGEKELQKLVDQMASALGMPSGLRY
jgi:hypothetical protein